MVQPSCIEVRHGATTNGGAPPIGAGRAQGNRGVICLPSWRARLGLCGTSIHESPMDRKAVGIFVFGFIVVAIGSLVVPKSRMTLWGIYFTYEECLADRLPGTQNDLAARGIMMACGNRFPDSTHSTDRDVTQSVRNLTTRLERETLIISHETNNINVKSITIALTDGRIRREFDCTNFNGVQPRSRGELYCRIMQDGFDTSRWQYSVVRVMGSPN
jgi:hypothetical protein